MDEKRTTLLLLSDSWLHQEQEEVYPTQYPRDGGGGSSAGGHTYQEGLHMGRD